MSIIIDPSAHLSTSIRWGEFCVVGADVEIGPDCEIGHHVVIAAGTKIGAGVRIDDGAILGKLPMRAANTAVTKDQPLPPAQVGDGAIIGAHVVIYRGATLGQRVLIADLSTVRENVTIGDFTIVGRGVAIENACTIGRYCKLETNVYITAYSTLGDRVFVAPGALTSNDNFVGRTEERFKHFKGVTVGRGARIGVGAVILPGKTVGDDALIAAGAVLTSDAPARQIMAGVPARAFRAVPSEQLLDAQNWPDVKRTS
ncbi:MAG: N-acetyltransferase [candidate division Zixibacteria bacterium]|nr:N-acetyltransferase [candidate division Zixibacteria bacterium]